MLNISLDFVYGRSVNLQHFNADFTKFNEDNDFNHAQKIATHINEAFNSLKVPGLHNSHIDFVLYVNARALNYLKKHLYYKRIEGMHTLHDYKVYYASPMLFDLDDGIGIVIGVIEATDQESGLSCIMGAFNFSIIGIR